jgi:NAD(P)-dependent dehydrogenase (short-subunit alcohol dehydrogenase family)
MPDPATPAASQKNITLVVGGSKGLGGSVARKLAREGHDVVVFSRTGPNLEGVTGSIRHIVADLQNREQLAAALAEVTRTARVGNLILSQRYRGTGDGWASELEVSLSATRFIIETLTETFAPAPPSCS